ncbi:hypothetical protein [Micromonospora sp. WMMD980]|uniref:hypothetical protein n=1 Tax=Micromonospora sp. WMMD980 TaxID=3016088 RepID=UPI002417ECA7|nr:hypothetical protein [Micromonospora sp. WMMD980]MDG4802298.1 hypothetical protein [Micromonospora sp. WMMD980]
MTERWVVHLPMVVNDLVSAQRLARVVAHWSSVLPQVEPGGTTVSPEDEQNVRHWAFCERRLSEGRRCVLRPDHEGDCSSCLRRR